MNHPVTLASAILLLGSTFAAAQPLSTQTATSRDGTRIAFDVAGSGPAIMLLHGGGQNRRVWRDAGYVDRLSREFMVISVDIRGNGDSDKPEPPSAYAIDKLIADLLAVADAAGVSRFHLWGFSYGANIGRYLASRSDRLLSMVYIGIPFGPAAEGKFREMIQQRKIGWLTAMLDYPPVEPSDMKCPTLWLVGTANENTMPNVKANQGKLAGTRVSLTLLDGLNHPQELSQIEVTLPAAMGFTRQVGS